MHLRIVADTHDVSACHPQGLGLYVESGEVLLLFLRAQPCAKTINDLSLFFLPASYFCDPASTATDTCMLGSLRAITSVLSQRRSHAAR